MLERETGLADARRFAACAIIASPAHHRPYGASIYTTTARDRDTAHRPLDSVRVQRNLRVVEEPHESQPQAVRVRDGLPECRARERTLRHQPPSDLVNDRLRLVASQGGERRQPLHKVSHWRPLVTVHTPEDAVRVQM